MCGIAGILNFKNNSEISPDLLSQMLSIISHRGPDEFGIHTEAQCGLGHARLSIIDLISGQQPMANEDKTIWITFNGEIFNYEELRKDLLKKSHTFSTNSDTEVIIHLYEDYGAESLNYLNGQFAFALWDRNTKELFIARDRMGIRPLFYSTFRNLFYFASEIKSIFAGGKINCEIDQIALDQIFTTWSTVPPKTAFKNIQELPPGYYLKIKNGVIKKQQYWDLVFPHDNKVLPFEEALERLRELLVDATRLRLKADVSVGAYLSGGLDSSVIAALIKKFSNRSLQTFSVSFEDKKFDESSYQKKMSRYLGTEHNEIRCTYRDINENFPGVIWHTEKPILRTAPVPLYILSKLVKEKNYKVVLTGEGADEVLGGYDIFKETKIRQFWARFPNSKYRPLLLKKLYPYLPAFQGQPRAYMEAFFNESLSDTSDIFFSHRPRWLTTSKTKLFFSKYMKQELANKSSDDDLKKFFSQELSSWPPFARAQYIEIKNLLPGYLLSSQGDRVTMAHSIEGRYPFLDHRVVEFCTKLPYHYKMKGLNEKYILKKSMKPYLPQDILKRTKQPYLAPDSNSFFYSDTQSDYVEELLSEQSIKNFGYFNPKSVKLLVKKCKRGGIAGFRDNMALVGILSTQLLHYQFVKNFQHRLKINKLGVTYAKRD